MTALNWETIDQYQSSHASIPGRIMYNRFHKCVLENKILYTNNLVFKLVILTTDHEIIQIDDQIFEAFENNLFTPGIFIGYSKSL